MRAIRHACHIARAVSVATRAEATEGGAFASAMIRQRELQIGSKNALDMLLRLSIALNTARIGLF